jgi:hypothetical protein
MKVIVFYFALFAFINIVKAQKVPMNASNIAMSRSDVSACNIPNSGWFQIVAERNFDNLALPNSSQKPSKPSKVKKIGQFKISPNPATDVLSVSQSSEKATSGEWSIFDTAGKFLLSKKVSENDIETTLNIQGLSEGIYFVSFSVNGQKRFTQKLIKIKSN